MAETVYKTEDGREFSSQYQAQDHANYLARQNASYRTSDGRTWGKQIDGEAWECCLSAKRYYDQGNSDGAIELCARGLEYNSQANPPLVYEILVSLYRFRGLAEFQRGDVDKAIATYSVPLDNDASNRLGARNVIYSGNPFLRHVKCSLHLNRGLARMKKGLIEEAIEDFKECFSYSESDGDTAQYRNAAQENIAIAEQDEGYKARNQGFIDSAKEYAKAAEQGDKDAQYNLAYLYYKGRGVPWDHSKAAEWYRKAAEQGHVNAQEELAGMYLSGDGVTKNHATAKEWYEKAAAQGNKWAKEQVERILNQEKRKSSGYSDSSDYSSSGYSEDDYSSSSYSDDSIGAKLLGILFGILGAVALLAIALVVLTKLDAHPLMNLAGLLVGPVLGYTLGWNMSHSSTGKLIVLAALIGSGIFFVWFNWSAIAPYFDKAPTEQTQTAPAAPAVPKATALNPLILRAEPSAKAKSVKTVAKGETVSVIGAPKNGWQMVMHGTDKGWVSSKHLKAK